MNINFPMVRKNFGFGCMRLPMIEKEVDMVEFSKMVDTFLENGFNYFDTAQGYLEGKSETALRECLSSRYPRESYILTDKLSPHLFNSEADIRPAFEKQLEACGVEYFDFYLMHCQQQSNYDKYQSCRAYEIAQELKAEGKIKHVGFSFHDNAEFLDKILCDHPEIEVVQIQFNYADYDDPSVESRKCYEVCRKHGKPIIVMEPVKGGHLVNIPEKAKEVFYSLGDLTPASYAIRFAASFEGVFMVLSGMGNMEMMNDNISYMKNFEPLNNEEFEAIYKVLNIIKEQGTIQCTACRYCVDGCPMNIPIPDLFTCMNGKKIFNAWNYIAYYQSLTKDGGKAGTCIECGACESACPQHLPIRELLKETAKEFDNIDW